MTFGQGSEYQFKSSRNFGNTQQDMTQGYTKKYIDIINI